MIRAKVLLTALVVLGVMASASAEASHTAATLTIRSATCTGCKWSQGWFKGSVKFSAVVDGASQLQATVRSAKTNKLVIAPRVFSVGAGTFTKTIALSSRPLPTGAYLMGLTGTSGGVSLPAVTKTFAVPTPVEGVADRSYASATKNGKPVKVISGGPHVIYAHFHFLQRPTQASKVQLHMAETELHRRRHGDEEVPRHVLHIRASLGRRLGTRHVLLLPQGLRQARQGPLRPGPLAITPTGNRRRLAQVDRHLVRDVLGEERVRGASCSRRLPSPIITRLPSSA